MHLSIVLPMKKREGRKQIRKAGDCLYQKGNPPQFILPTGSGKLRTRLVAPEAYLLAVLLHVVLLYGRQ